MSDTTVAGRRWLAWVAGAALVLAGVLVVLWVRNGSEAAGQVLEVDLFGEVGDLHGVDWPRAPDGDLRLSTAVEEPHEVRVEVGGETLLTASQVTLIEQRAGEVVATVVQPMGRARDIGATVGEVRAWLTSAGVDTREVAADLDAWTEDPEIDPLSPNRRSLRVDIERSSAFVQVRPTSGGGWFFVVELSRPLDEWPED